MFDKTRPPRADTSAQGDQYRMASISWCGEVQLRGGSNGRGRKPTSENPDICAKASRNKIGPAIGMPAERIAGGSGATTPCTSPGGLQPRARKTFLHRAKHRLFPSAKVKGEADQ